MTNVLSAAAVAAADVLHAREPDHSDRYQLRYFGDEILRAECPPIPATDDAARRELPHVVRALHRERAKWRGLGLSANQVGSQLRVFVACLSKNETITFVNPEYIGEKGVLMRCPGEGCLSIPGFRTSTKRHESVTLRWQDEAFGPMQARTFHGLAAQIVQHEMDHMRGVLLVDLDGITRQQRRSAERLVARHIEKLMRRA